jgi:hypothetical protein
MLLRQRGQDSPRCATGHEAIYHPTNLDIEDEEEEEEDNTEEMEGDGTDDAQAASSMDDWEDTFVDIDGGDGDGDEDEESGASVEMLILDDPGQEYFISLSDPQKAAIDELKEMLHPNSLATDSEILDSFANVIFQVFVSQPSDSVINPYHTPIEAFLISRGLDKEGRFRSSMQMSCTFSKVQYIGLYTITRECIKPGKEPLG